MKLSFSSRALALAVLLTISACSDETNPGIDASSLDSSVADANVPDAAIDDAATVDANVADAAVDATVADGAVDAGPTIADGGCTPPTNDSSAIGDTCDAEAACPTGYTCQGFSGVVFTQSCQILCTDDCGCPSGLSCVTRGDKGGTWMQCAAP